jgi:hypothetical protein
MTRHQKKERKKEKPIQHQQRSKIITTAITTK